MKRLPLRHVPLFWIGLLPVVILLWAWADSTRYDNSWTDGSDSPHLIQLSLSGSALNIGTDSFIAFPGRERETAQAVADLHRGVQMREWLRRPRAAAGFAEQPLFRTPSYEIDRQFFGDFCEQRSSFRVIPLWMILLPYLPAWLLLTWWQARRKARRLGGVPGDR